MARKTIAGQGVSMSDRLTVLLLRVYRVVAFVLGLPNRLVAWLCWLELRYTTISFEVFCVDMFNAPHCEIESRLQLRIDHWLRKACRLEQAAKARRQARTPSVGL